MPVIRYKTDAENKDIRDALELPGVIKEAVRQTSRLAMSLRSTSDAKTLYNVWNYAKKSVKFREDSTKKQNITLPYKLIKRGYGDCKSISLMIAAILVNLKYKPHWVYATYNDNDLPSHVYICTKCHSGFFILDAVYQSFNKEKKPRKRYFRVINLKNMDVNIISGHNKGQNRNRRKGQYYGAEHDNRSYNNHDNKRYMIGNDANAINGIRTSSKIKKFPHGVLKALVVPRTAFLIVVRANLLGIATILSAGLRLKSDAATAGQNHSKDFSTRLNFGWYNLGGEYPPLLRAIRAGENKKPRLMFLAPRELKTAIRENTGISIGNYRGIGVVAEGSTVVTAGAITLAVIALLREALAAMQANKDKSLDAIEAGATEDPGANSNDDDSRVKAGVQPWMVAAAVGFGLFMTMREKK